MTTKKVWQAEDIRGHLLAVRSAMHASAAQSLVSDYDGRLRAYCQGGEAALQYLANRFGVSLHKSPQATAHIEAHNATLRTWTRDETKSILEEVKLIMLEGYLIPPGQGHHHTRFKEGIQNTLTAVGLSFRIMDL